MAKEAYVKVGAGTDKKKVTGIYVKIAGATNPKKVTAGYVKDGTNMRQFWPSATPVSVKYQYYYASKAGVINTWSDITTGLITNPASASPDHIRFSYNTYSNRDAYIYGTKTSTGPKTTVYKINSNHIISSLNTGISCGNLYSACRVLDGQGDLAGVVFTGGSSMFAIDDDDFTEISNVTSVPALFTGSDTSAALRVIDARSTAQEVYYSTHALIHNSSSANVYLVEGGQYTVRRTLANLSESKYNAKALGFNFRTTNTDYEKWYGTIFVGGRTTSSNVATNTIDIYSTTGNVKHFTATLPCTIENHAMANVGNLILIAGGTQAGATGRRVFTINREYTIGETTQLSVARWGLVGGTIGQDWDGNGTRQTATYTNNAIFAGGYTAQSSASNATDRYILKKQLLNNVVTESLMKVSIDDLTYSRTQHCAYNVTTSGGADRLVFGFGNYSSNADAEYFTGVYKDETLTPTV